MPDHQHNLHNVTYIVHTQLIIQATDPVGWQVNDNLFDAHAINTLNGINKHIKIELSSVLGRTP